MPLSIIAVFLGILACKERPKDWINIDTVAAPIDAKLFGIKQPPKLDFDADLTIYLNNFLRDAKSRGVLINDKLRKRLRVIKWVDKFTSTSTSSSVLAMCSRYFSSQRSIAGVKEVRWSTIEVLKKRTLLYTEGSETLLKELMYHELFHCLMNKGHLPKQYFGIMSPHFAKGSKRAYKAWDSLVDDMFSEFFINIIPDVNF